MSKLTDDDVRYVARLSKLDLSEEEIASIKTQMSDILSYIEKLNEVDTAGVEPTAQVTGLENVEREDVVSGEQISQAELLKNVPTTDDNGNIRVKRVL